MIIKLITSMPIYGWYLVLFLVKHPESLVTVSRIVGLEVLLVAIIVHCPVCDPIVLTKLHHLFIQSHPTRLIELNHLSSSSSSQCICLGAQWHRPS